MSTWLKLIKDTTDDACLVGWETMHSLQHRRFNCIHLPIISQALLFISEIYNDRPLLLTTAIYPLIDIEMFVSTCQDQGLDAAATLSINDADQGMMYFQRGADFILCAQNAFRNHNPHEERALSLLDCFQEATLKQWRHRLIRRPL